MAGTQFLILSALVLAPFFAPANTAVSAPKVPSTEDRWSSVLKNVQEHRKKGTPMAYSNDAWAPLGLAQLECSAALKQKIEKCEFYSCVYPINIMGTKLSADIVVHGLNKFDSCVVSAPNAKRYFIPKTDLPFFYDALIATVRTDKMKTSVSVSTNNDIQKTQQTVFHGEVGCNVTVETQMVLDTANLLPAKPENRKKFPDRTVISSLGKDYIGKESDTPNMQFITKTISSNLDKAAPAVCKERRIDLLFQLAVKNMEFDFIPERIGF